MTRRQAGLFALVLSAVSAAATAAAVAPLATPRTSRPGTQVAWSDPTKPLILGLTGKASDLDDPVLGKVGRILRQRGYLVVSIDLPCHGSDLRPGEPVLPTERVRYRQSGVRFVEDFCRSASGLIDAFRPLAGVRVYGVSRGGFMAAHLAARDMRVRRVALLAPVTNPGVLREFGGDGGYDADAGRDLTPTSVGVARCKAWIADQDDRVDSRWCGWVCGRLGIELAGKNGLAEHNAEPFMDEAAEWLGAP